MTIATRTDGSTPEIDHALPAIGRDAAAFAPRWRARLIARISRARLDRALSDGADPSASEWLAARAAQLSGGAGRRQLAAALESMAGVSERRSYLTVNPDRIAVAVNRKQMLALAATLRSSRPVYVQGLAAVEVLVTDGTGPAYTDRRGEALARALELAGAALNG